MCDSLSLLLHGTSAIIDLFSPQIQTMPAFNVNCWSLTMTSLLNLIEV
jgi:hypothetical protein